MLLSRGGQTAPGNASFRDVERFHFASRVAGVHQPLMISAVGRSSAAVERPTSIKPPATSRGERAAVAFARAAG
jgi:hypothetical protein